MSLFPYLDEALEVFFNASWKLLEYPLKMNAEAGLEMPKTAAEEEASSSSFFSLSKLRAMTIQFYDGLQSLPECLKCLSSLKSLEIGNCCDIVYFYKDDAIMWQSLRSLRLDALKKLVALPKEIQHLTNLQTFKIFNCQELVEIPEWISNLKPLKEFHIEYCDSLQSLPEGMCSLICLKHLVIYECLYLFPRCQKETGKYWPKIAHIPSVYIGKIEYD